jgi:hypothetical protein
MRMAKCIIERAWRVTHVYVRLQVQNVTQKPRFIRVCGEQDGENYLCALATHVEVRSHRSRQPSVKHDAQGVFGGIPLQKSISIPPGQSERSSIPFRLIGSGDR